MHSPGRGIMPPCSRDFPDEEGTESAYFCEGSVCKRRSRDFPDEEGTESGAVAAHGAPGADVPETSPMKRGLKGCLKSLPRRCPKVPETSPMKRGLKDSRTNLK